MSNEPRTVADLQRMANEAGAYAASLDKLLQSIALVEKALEKAGPTGGLTYAWGLLGVYSKLHLFVRTGKAGDGKPPNPAFTKESYMAECAAIYDTIENYYETSEDQP